MDNEKENEFLAAVDIEDVHVTNKGDAGTIQKADRSIEVNKHKFVNFIKELLLLTHQVIRSERLVQISCQAL